MSRLAVSVPANKLSNTQGLNMLHQRYFGLTGGFSEQKIIPSGIAALDDLLPDGGWRKGSVTEIYADMNNDSAMNLILPTFVNLSQEKKWLGWIAPPHFLDRSKIASSGVSSSRVLLVHPRTTANGLWAVEEALRAGTFSAVMIWMIGGDAASNFSSLQRLQHAAEEGECLVFVFRHDRYAQHDSPAAIRLRLTKQQHRIQIQRIGVDANLQPAPEDQAAKTRVLKFSANRLARQSHGGTPAATMAHQLSLY